MSSYAALPPPVPSILLTHSCWLDMAMRSRLQLSEEPVPLRHIWTASEAQMDLMTHVGADTPNSRLAGVDLGIPFRAKVFVIAGGEGFWLNSLRMKDSLRFDSWDIRTSLSDEVGSGWRARSGCNSQVSRPARNGPAIFNLLSPPHTSNPNRRRRRCGPPRRQSHRRGVNPLFTLSCSWMESWIH